MNALNLAVIESELSPDPEPETLKGRRAALPAPSEILSPRERQVVTLLHTGLTRKEVAYELGLNDATVRVHLWHAQRKTRRAR
jgi:DNA-binding NarL/FixJ family response regulator